jgi:hypothetical protein
MIRIHATRGPDGEAEIEGRSDDFVALKRGIDAFLTACKASLVVPADTAFDPAPYDLALPQLVLILGTGPNVIQVREDALSITGGVAALRNFTDNLPAGWDPRCHVHYDWIWSEEMVSRESTDLVFSVME